MFCTSFVIYLTYSRLLYSSKIVYFIQFQWLSCTICITILIYITLYTILSFLFDNTNNILSILTHTSWTELPKISFLSHLIRIVIFMDKYWYHQYKLVIELKFIYNFTLIIHVNYIIEYVWKYPNFSGKCRRYFIYMWTWIHKIFTEFVVGISLEVKYYTKKISQEIAIPPLILFPSLLCHYFPPCSHFHPPFSPVMSNPKPSPCNISWHLQVEGISLKKLELSHLVFYFENHAILPKMLINLKSWFDTFLFLILFFEEKKTLLFILKWTLSVIYSMSQWWC